MCVGLLVRGSKDVKSVSMLYGYAIGAGDTYQAFLLEPGTRIIWWKVKTGSQ